LAFDIEEGVMMRIILVRHGKTDWSNIDRIQGEVDIPLNDEGLEQAKGIASKLSGEKIEAIFSSQLARSYITAEKIAMHHKLKVKKVKELNEVNQGLWQGLLLSAVKKRYKRQYSLWKQDPTLVQPPKGESIKDAYDRVITLVQKLIDKYYDGTICIVSHEIITGLIKCHFKSFDLKDMWTHALNKAMYEIIEIEKV